MNDVPFTCPRRHELCAHGFDVEGEDYWRDGLTCSYCGSLSPDVFMRRIRARDVVLVPTDKNYKVYVRNDGGEPFPLGKQDKFYFQHLSDDQQIEFVSLLNQGVMRLAIPGHFYRLPFFVTRKSK